MKVRWIVLVISVSLVLTACGANPLGPAPAAPVAAGTATVEIVFLNQRIHVQQEVFYRLLCLRIPQSSPPPTLSEPTQAPSPYITQAHHRNSGVVCLW